MKNEKMILFSDYVEDKKELENNISSLIIKFFSTYPVVLQEVSVITAPGFDDFEQIIDGVEIIVK